VLARVPRGAPQTGALARLKNDANNLSSAPLTWSDRDALRLRGPVMIQMDQDGQPSIQLSSWFGLVQGSNKRAKQLSNHWLNGVRGITPPCIRRFARSHRAADDSNPDCQVNPAQDKRDSVFRSVALERLSLLSSGGSDNSLYLCDGWHTTRARTIRQRVHRALTSVSRLSRGGQPNPESYRPQAWTRKLETVAIICASLLASFDAVNADELLYLRCNLSGVELSGGQSKSYNDTVLFKLNLQTNEAWEIHPDHLLHHKRRITAEIDKNAIRLSRGEEGDVQSSDTSYRIDRSDGRIVFSHRTTWYDVPMGDDDSLTHATGTCEKAPGPLPSRAQVNSSS
jgi:hypothetical protein